MHEAALARAAQPVPVIVLGLMLRPFSIGHMLQFYREGLVESASRGIMTPVELTAAVLVCSQSWEQSSGIERDHLLPLKMWAWKKRVEREAKRNAKLRAAVGALPDYFPSERDTFNAYLIAGSADFAISETPRADRSSSSRIPGAPFILRLQQWLMTHLRFTEAQAWDYPFGLAKMRWATHWEMEGGLDIENEHDKSFDRFVAEHEAKRAMQPEAARN